MTNLIHATNFEGGGRFEVLEVHNRFHIYGLDPVGLFLVLVGALIFRCGG